MTRRGRDIGAEILQALREIKRGEYGRVTNVPDITQIREKTGLSPRRALLNCSVCRSAHCRIWEQGRRAPSRTARTLLMVATRNPHALLEGA